MDALGVKEAAPLWLATPSRFAGLSLRGARIGVALLALLLLATLLALASPGAPPINHDPANRGEDQVDVVRYETIVQGVRGGGGYYPVTAQALRAGDDAMQPFLTFRLPTLAVVQAALPPAATMLLLYALVAGVMFAWYRQVRSAFATSAPVWVAMALLAGGLIAFVKADLACFHEIWAGLLIALSLAARRGDKWIEAVAIGLIAMLIRETAALYVVIMAVFAFAEGHRKEAIGWATTLGVLAIVLALHAHAVSLVVRETDPAVAGWPGPLGFGFFITTMQLWTVLTLAPLWFAAPVIGLALFGWAAWKSALALRALAMFSGYAALLALFGRADTFYWGLMIAPTLLIGLAFAPDGVRDLIARAQGPRRKITVTRVVR